jgi:hypothetical protein
MYCSTRHGWRKVVSTASTADASCGGSRTVLADRLHDEREGEIARVVRTREHAAWRRGDARGLEPLLHSVLPEREAQHLRRRSREGYAEELEQQWDGALEPRVAAERLAKIERACRVELGEPRAEAREVSIDRDEVRFVRPVGQRRGDRVGHALDLGPRRPRRVVLRPCIFEVDVVEHRDPLAGSGAPRPWGLSLLWILRRVAARRCLERHGLRVFLAVAHASLSDNMRVSCESTVLPIRVKAVFA